MVDYNGLAVRPVGCAGGAVAHMGNGHGSRRKFFHHIPGEHLANLPQISVGGEHSIIVYNDAAALLPPVLQGVQPIVSEVPATRHQTHRILREGLSLYPPFRKKRDTYPGGVSFA